MLGSRDTSRHTRYSSRQASACQQRAGRRLTGPITHLSITAPNTRQVPFREMCVSMPSKHKMDQHSAARRRLCWTRPKLVPRPNPTEQPTPCELPRTLVPACLRAHRALYQVLQLTSQHANAFPCCPPHFPHIRPRRYHALWPLHPLAPPPCGSWRHHPQASLPISLASASHQPRPSAIKDPLA